MKNEILVFAKDSFVRAALEHHCSKYTRTCTVSTVGDAVIALERNLAAAILDMNHAESNAIEVLEKIRKTKEELPILVLVGNASIEAVGRASELDADFLLKFDDIARLEQFLYRVTNN